MIFDRIYDILVQRRQRIVEGKSNCIPIPFARFSTNFPGFERARYGILTASQKVGKSKLADYLVIYAPLFYMIEHPNEYKEKVLYFTLEMSKEEKYYDFLCHLLYRLDGIEIGTLDLKSTSKNKPIPEEYLELLKTEKYQRYIKAYEEMVIFIDDIKNPTGINKACRDYAEKHGKFHYKDIQVKNDFTGEIENKSIVDYFEWEDPECYYMIVLDNLANLTQESNMSKMDNIIKMSKYFVTLRNQLEFHILAIQHQAQAQEGVENRKLNMLYPTVDGLGDAKATSRDIDYIMGLFNPFKYGIRNFNDYDITKFKKRIRFLMMLDDRNSGSGGDVCPLLFNGASTMFDELPSPADPEINKVYAYLENLDKKDKQGSLFFINKKSKHRRTSFRKRIYNFATRLKIKTKCQT